MSQKLPLEESKDLATFLLVKMQMALMGMLLLATICSISAESIQLNCFQGIILEGTHAGQETALRKGVQRANQNLAELRLHAPLKITLHPILKRIEEGSAFAASEAACELVAENVVAIFGPDSKAASGPAQWISQQYSIPYFLAQGDLDTDETLFNFTVNLHPHFEDVGEALVDFIQGTQGWEELGLIYAHDDSKYYKWLHLIKYKSLFSKFSRKLTVRKWDGADQRHKYIIKYFRRTRSQNKFVVDIPRTETEGFLRLIAEYNMTDQYYSYVFTDWDTQFLDPKAFVVDKGANFSALSLLPLMGFNYQMTEDTHRPFSQSPAFLPSRGASSSTARSSLVLIFAPNSFMMVTRVCCNNDSVHFLMFSSQTYYFLISDTLNLLSIGISRLAESRTIEPPSGLSCKAAGNWSLGPHLLSAIKSVKGNDAEGSTGLVEFGSEGRRKNVNITILEMGKDGFLEYGYWNRKDKLVVTKDFSKTKSEIQKELKGQTLRVATIEEIPFMMYKGPSGHVKSSDPKDWHGFCIDLLNECASALEFNYTVHPVADGNYGTATKVNGEVVWDGIIGQLQFRKADLAVAMLTINLERERVIDFTTPFMNLGVSIIFKKPEQNEPDLFSFLRPLSPAPSHPIFRHTDLLSTASLLILLNRLLSHLRSDILPKATSTRIIAGFWGSFALIIISSYTANLAAFLTVERMQAPIKDVNDLAKQTKIKYGTRGGGSSADFFAVSNCD
ncbi:unnamed protein product [Mesocestoides corti]|uniref:Ionotropic glutamate receptor L-glutamate and glycine-binding domain-containing protein n=1 Tax=Mesocestoides corti TaxID=53468 RepID=A0A158QW73_MESCO|nr:unnamed protein product [Mesocestoides corti]